MKRQGFILSALLVLLLALPVPPASAYSFTSSCPQGFTAGTANETVPETNLPEALCDTLTITDLLPKQGGWANVLFSGELRSPVPVDLLYLYLWDERSLSLEQTYTVQLEQPAESVDAERFNDLLCVDRIRAGRKTLVIQGISGGEPIVLARLFFIVRGNALEPAHITDQCELSIAEPLLDSSVKTAWKPENGASTLTVRIPEGTTARLLTLEWQVPPDSFSVAITDRNGQTISETVYQTGFYLDSVELDEKTGCLQITPAGDECALSSVRVYPERYAEFAVQKWQPLPEKADLMLFSAHQDDELLFFGGMIPYYSEAGKTVAVVYMANCGRDRYAEALDGLWTAGLKYHPIFVGWRDGRFFDDDMLKILWEYDTPNRVLTLVRLIRKYRPDVVVTHDFRGEYGNWHHRETAVLAAEAAVLAADPACDAESGQKPWEVKKVYIHLYEENRITMDWDQPLDGETGLTPRMLEMEAYDKHRSQHVYDQMDDYGRIYDNSCFGLYYSTVGEDREKNDLFENISPR
ncbi:MAG: PIG-L family deacetylase [Clostridia bacterium]|nr:PIG-L family deacetylase [Clostridia bacterium]